MALIDKIILKKDGEDDLNGELAVNFDKVFVEETNHYTLKDFYEKILDFFTKNMFQYYCRVENLNKLKENIVECYIVTTTNNEELSENLEELPQ